MVSLKMITIMKPPMYSKESGVFFKSFKDIWYKKADNKRSVEAHLRDVSREGFKIS